MRILVDTHSFLWDALGDRRSSSHAIELMGDESNELFFSVASLWEIAIKMRLGRLPGLGPDINYVRDLLVRYKMEVLPIRFEHLTALGGLPLGEHRDPFDRMLVAQAVAEALPILSKDAKLKGYPVTLLWS
jgi:PIN domain nuclease of toxin-antitoxin system